MYIVMLCLWDVVKEINKGIFLEVMY